MLSEKNIAFDLAYSDKMKGTYKTIDILYKNKYLR